MVKKNSFVKFEELVLEKLYVGNSNVRAENVQTDIDILAEHIYVNGILEPIVVFSVDDLQEGHELFASRQSNKGKYEILAGQRRFSAFQKLNEEKPGEGFDKISCHVRVPPEDELDAKSISIGENLTQLPMTLADSIDACDALFRKYGDEKTVAKKYGISPQLVKKYVKFARLPEYIQERLGEIHKSPKIAMNIALDACDARDYSKDDPDSVKKVFELAKRLSDKKDTSSEDYKKYKTAAEENPTATLEVLDIEATKLKNPKVYKIRLDPSIATDLDIAAETNGQSSEEEGAEIIEEGLHTRISKNK